jgi:TolB-like protein
MKTFFKKIAVLCCLLAITNTFAQTIAVAPIKTFGLVSESAVVTRFVQLELVKLNKYAVMDRFDMNEIEASEKYDSCFGKTCLVEYGKALGSDFIVSGNVDGLGNKIVVNLKLIDVKTGEISKNKSVEFDNQEPELQRMIGIVLEEMHGITPDAETMKRLAFKNEVITSNNVGKINNSGPRMGIAYTVGTVNEFVTRSKAEGGLEIQPVMSNLGYQFEGQYVGTENFSALFECLVMFSGLEQGKFIPSISFLNGYRFGKSGWEFAFGPSFSLSKTSTGFFDTDGLYGNAGKYWREKEFEQEGHNLSSLDETGYELQKTLDIRGDLGISTRWVIGFGRTFRSGALNIPVNLFYSSQKGGGMAGLSVGFNIIRAKKPIN